MKVRRPEILKESPPIIWSKDPEIALLFNAMSAVIPHVEHYLNSVIGEVRDSHAADDPQLRRTLDDFIGQETEHSRLHMQFNRWLYEGGYEALKPRLRTITNEYRALRRNHKSIAFHAAYCAGFENVATFSAQYILGPGLKHFEGADAAGANLHLWHVAEEFEHRAVCHAAFEKVSGNYFLRIWGLFYAFTHVMYSFKRAVDVSFAIHRKGMGKAQKAASSRRLRQFLLDIFGFMWPRMLALFSPSFDPSKIPLPNGVDAALRYFSSAETIESNFGDVEKVNAAT